ncbi:MAG: hypothetical protein ACI82F_004700 [Planctomycetota bacterium]|jgi:hypothetical protein
MKKGAQETGRNGRRWVTAALCSVLILLGWCVADYIYVVHPEWNEAHPSGERLQLLALAAAILAICWYRHRGNLASAAVALGLSLAGGLLLILFVGMQYHFSIGGKL